MYCRVITIMLCNQVVTRLNLEWNISMYLRQFEVGFIWDVHPQSLAYGCVFTVLSRRWRYQDPTCQWYLPVCMTSYVHYCGNLKCSLNILLGKMNGDNISFINDTLFPRFLPLQILVYLPM